MKNEVFELAKVTNEYIVLKVKAEDNFVIATHPYVNATYDYITVTRGKNHILTIVYKDGKTFDFHWGRDGYKLISKGLESLKKEVVNFIEMECYIPLETTTDIYTKANIFYNHNFNSWQINLNEEYIICRNCNSLEETINFAENFIGKTEWKYKKAITGIDVWNAII